MDCHSVFRKKFDLARAPAKAPFFITADQSYRLFVNGRFVCRGPARGFQPHYPFDEADLAPFLRRGRNLVAIYACNPGRSTYQYVSHGIAGVLAGGHWGGTEVVTDGSWRCASTSRAACASSQASRPCFGPRTFCKAPKKFVKTCALICALLPVSPRRK